MFFLYYHTCELYLSFLESLLNNIFEKQTVEHFVKGKLQPSLNRVLNLSVHATAENKQVEVNSSTFKTLSLLSIIKAIKAMSLKKQKIKKKQSLLFNNLEGGRK